MEGHSQPIALPAKDHQMHDPGSYSSTGTFNPASFTRHFIGSPISWRASSFGAPRFPAGSPTAQLLTSLEKSPDTGRDAIRNALGVFDREGELCRNYTCCGRQLNDLHALLEHFEDVHIVVLDPSSAQPQAHIQIPFNPTVHEQPPPAAYGTSFDPDDMELDIDLDSQPPLRSSPSSGAPSPPDTPISTPLSAYPSPYVSQPPSPRQSSPTYMPTRHIAPGGFPRPPLPANNLLAHPEDVFNPYARFASDYSSCMPGAQFNAATVDEASAVNSPLPWQHQVQQQSVPPALLFASSASVTPSTSRVPSPTLPQQQPLATPTSPSHSAKTTLAQPQQQQQQQTPLSTQPIARHPPTLLLSKPFRCPKPNCNKSYKQANGLKYHMTHGSCNFAPPKDLEHVKDLLERKRREREQQAAAAAAQGGAGLTRSASLGSAAGSAPIPIPHGAQTEPTTPTSAGLPGGAPLSPTSILQLTYSDLSNISESDLREVEREAERRLRPFACGVGDCQRRYKNMNGLRYHYQHSGDHGAVGLALLASGQHECLGAGKRGKTHSTSGSGNGGSHLHMHSGTKSVPASRSQSVASSRVGTPQPQPQSHVKSDSAGSIPLSTTTTTVITPTPIQATAFVVPSSGSACPSPPTTASPTLSTSGSSSSPQPSTTTSSQPVFYASQAQQQFAQAAAAYHHYAQMQYQARVAQAQAQMQAQQQQQQQGQAQAQVQVQSQSAVQQVQVQSGYEGQHGSRTGSPMHPQSSPSPQQQQQQWASPTSGSGGEDVMMSMTHSHSQHHSQMQMQMQSMMWE